MKYLQRFENKHLETTNLPSLMRSIEWVEGIHLEISKASSVVFHQ
jgi:hypothetical protein